jgi:hypothetical protein
MTDNESYARIAQFVESHPDLTYAEIGKALGLTRSQVSRIARLQGVKRGPGKRSAALTAAVAAIEAFGQKVECEVAKQALPSADEAVPSALDLAPADAPAL